MAGLYTETELHSWYFTITTKLNGGTSGNLLLQEKGLKVKKSEMVLVSF